MTVAITNLTSLNRQRGTIDSKAQVLLPTPNKLGGSEICESYEFEVASCDMSIFVVYVCQRAIKVRR
jgi:hypothetical protein